MKLLLVASAGGHLQHLLWLRPWWSAHARTWVTFDGADARAALAGEVVDWAHHPTNRNLPNAVRNLALAARVVLRELPDLLVTTGAGVAVPFVLAARAAGVRTVFVEVQDRRDRPSLTGRLVAPWVDVVVLTDPAQAAAYPSGVLLGPMR